MQSWRPFGHRRAAVSPAPNLNPADGRSFRGKLGRWNAHAVHRLWKVLRLTVASVVEHDCLNMAQAAAYSAMVSLFPALIVVAAVVTRMPDSAPLRLQAAMFFDRVLPPDVSPMLESYFENRHQSPHSTHALIVAAVVSLTGASSVIVTLMEGFRRAFRLPADGWGFWDRRWRSFALVPIALVPLLVASSMIVFGHVFTEWVWRYIGAEARTPVFVLSFVIRWVVSLIGSVGIIAVIYHMGVPPAGIAALEVKGSSAGDSLWGSVRTVRAMSTMETSWQRTLPGATVATAMWSLTTLAFGWYVTRFANYSEVYGSLGAGIALLFWLYIVLLSVLAGAEFNAQLYPAYCGDSDGDSLANAPVRG